MEAWSNGYLNALLRRPTSDGSLGSSPGASAKSKEVQFVSVMRSIGKALRRNGGHMPKVGNPDCGELTRHITQAFNAKGLRPPVSVALYGRVSIMVLPRSRKPFRGDPVQVRVLSLPPTR